MMTIGVDSHAVWEEVPKHLREVEDNSLLKARFQAYATRRHVQSPSIF